MPHPVPHEAEQPIDSAPELAEIEIISLGPDAAERGEIERQWKSRRCHHLTMLVISITVIVLCFALQIGHGGRVSLVGFSRFPLPELCGSRLMFNTECPGCGLTRSFLALAAGDWQQSWAFHRVGWILAFAVVLQVPYRLYRLQKPEALQEAHWPTWCGHLLIALLIINWLIKICVR